MKLIKFNEVNVVIAKDQPEYLPMPAHIADNTETTTTICWQGSWSERLKFLLTGKMWHQILTFRSAMQPQLLTTTKPKL